MANRIDRLLMRLPRRIRQDVDEEIRFHLEQRAAELERQGFPPGAAREEALRRFGDLESTRAACYGSDLRKVRRVHRGEYRAELVQDAKQGLRQLRRRPGFTAAAVLTLAIGIGATTAIFSVADHVVLRPLSYDGSDRIVTLWETNRDRRETHNEVSPGNFISWEERSASFSSMGLAEPHGVALAGEDGGPESFPTWNVTEKFFGALGVRPILGPGFSHEHFVSGGPAAIMISHSLWQRRFGGDPSVVGRAIEVDESTATVVGILPPWLEYPSPRDIWTPKTYRSNEPGDRRSAYMFAVARLTPGVSKAEAQAELDTVAATLGQEFPRTNEAAGVRLVPLEDEMLGGVRPALMVLLGAVVFLLLVACANVAHLVLARAAERGHELSVRASLGAGRARLVRQIMTESLLLALIGGVAGIAFAAAGVEAIIALSPPELPRIQDGALDSRVLSFAAAVTLATALLFGLAPAVRLSRPNALDALHGGRGAHLADRGGTRLRNGLVVAQIAVAMILLVGAGLMVQSFVRLLDNDLGFDIEHRTTLQAFIWREEQTAEQRIRMVAEIDAGFESLPGVESAAVISALPFHPTRIVSRMHLSVDGESTPDDRGPVSVPIASPDYFRTTGIPLLRGRPYRAGEAADGPVDVVINETLAREYFGDRDPVGRQAVLTQEPRSQAAGDREGIRVEIVGVVGDVRPTTFQSEAESELYLPYDRVGTGDVTFVVRTHGDAAAMMPALRKEVWRIEPTQSIYLDATVEQLVSDTLVARRFHLLLIGALAIVALVLAAVGVFGVISFATSRRVNEIGVRVALGARPRDVGASIVRRAVALAVPGVLLGAAASYGLTRFLAHMLYEVRPTDPATFAATGTLLLVVAALAAWLPARRATRIDPARALREE